MSLNRLEMFGFKSFMSPVSLEFKGGITAILGPNGCGKTNVVDAVRWVLGEQSARQLRSSKMENVIFNGTQLQKPTGFATVTMTINNEKGVFPLDYSEITISRKVYRSGISEYFINKTPCRLKDVRELFADTGTGSHSYAVIEQEMVEYVLNDTHGERRLMFEEASGIVKYRMRREEAKRKLKLTDADLVRLDDILDELGKNVRSLRYQVGKTKRYKKISERIRDWGIILLKKNLSGYLAEKREAESELESANGMSAEDSDSLSRFEKKVEEEKFLLIEYEKRNSELQNSRYEIRRKIQGSEEKVIQYTERKGEAERKIERALREIEEAKSRMERIVERISGVNTELKETSENAREEEDAIRGLGGRFEEISVRIERVKNELIDLKQTQLDFLQDQVRVQSSQEHYDAILKELDLRSNEMRERITGLEAQISDLASSMEEKDLQFRDCRTTLAGLEKERSSAYETMQAVDRSLPERESKLSEKKTELAKLISRHELYSRMKEDFEGFPGGARYLLKKGDTRVKGPLAEMLKVEEKYKGAIEAVLGGLSDGVVVDDLSGAMELISEISDSRLGSVRFFVEKTEKGENPYSPEDHPGSIGRLSSFVDVPGSRRGMIEDLLGKTILFEDPWKALEFVNSDKGRLFDAVTLSGVYFCRGKGIYYSGNSTEEISLLGRSGEIEKLQSSMEDLKEVITGEESECDRERKEKERLRTLLIEIDAKIGSTRIDLAGNQEVFQKVERDFIMSKEKCSLLMKSLDEIESSRVETIAKLEELKLSIAMRQDSGEVSDTVKLESELAMLTGRRNELEAVLTERKVRLASLQGNMDKHKEEIRGLSEMEKQFSSIMQQRSEEISSSKKEIAILEKEVEEERRIVTGFLEGESAFQKDIDELRGIVDEKREGITRMELDLKSRQEEREKIFSRINEVRIKLSSIDTRMKDLVERGIEIYKEDLGSYLEGKETVLTEEEKKITQEMLEKQKRNLESIGPVNLAAIEEYEEKKNRMDFLLSQKEDLDKAKEELQEAISRINKRARKLFVETFDVVKKYFSEIFTVLFEGGEASLTLEEGSDPLEGDIVISARPKGKRFQDISLLSGGERALTAMALLFALYKAKPSPFCIFDEVDAPLDDANIQRFVRMLTKFSEDTQFIIITHNKRTMEAADRLFGVTMEQKGISKIVSVDLTEVESVLQNRAAPEGAMAEAHVSSN